MYEDRLCEVCGKMYNKALVECELHFLLQCECYNSLRVKYFTNPMSLQKTMFNFIKIMKCKDIDVLKGTASFLFHAFSMRNTMNC